MHEEDVCELSSLSDATVRVRGRIRGSSATTLVQYPVLFFTCSHTSFFIGTIRRDGFLAFLLGPCQESPWSGAYVTSKYSTEVQETGLPSGPSNGLAVAYHNITRVNFGTLQVVDGFGVAAKEKVMKVVMTRRKQFGRALADSSSFMCHLPEPDLHTLASQTLFSFFCFKRRSRVTHRPCHTKLCNWYSTHRTRLELSQNSVERPSPNLRLVLGTEVCCTFCSFGLRPPLCS